jgi:NAD(P)-dependent dehydrogenase (short-subunit alcohol dehydrogenase family)
MRSPYLYTLAAILPLISDMVPQTWQRILDANLTGAFLTTQYSLPMLSSQAPVLFGCNTRAFAPAGAECVRGC